MFIELIIKDPEANQHVVRGYNDGTLYEKTTSLRRAIAVAIREATSFRRDALIRVITASTPEPEDRFSIDTIPSRLIPTTLRLYLVSYAVIARRFTLDTSAGIRRYLATRGNYAGARYRLRLPTPPPDAAPDRLSITCTTCLFTQPLAEYHNPGRCHGCQRPTCDFCDDNQGYCLDCTPILNNYLNTLLNPATHGSRSS